MSLITIIIGFVLLPFLFFVPGYLTCITFENNVQGRHSGLLESFLLPILGSVVIVSWVLIFLLIFSVFSLMNLFAILLLYSFIIALKGRKKIRFPSMPKMLLSWQVIFLTFLVVVSILLFFHPFEEIFGYGDGYIHVNIGGMIANHGAVKFNDMLIASLPEDVMNYFTFKQNQLFNNLLIIDYSTGEVVPAFLHLYASWIAIFLSAFGVEAALYVSPILGLISILVIFSLTRELFDWKTAVLASGLLMLNFLQIWFSRSHSAEILLQLLIFAGILTFILSRRAKSNFLYVLSALTFGLTLFTKIEATLIIIPILLYFTCLNLTGKLKKEYFFFILPFFVSMLVAIVYYLVIAKGYVFGSFFAEDIPQEIIILSVIFLITINLIPKKFINRILFFIYKKIKILQHIATLALVGYLIYAIFTLDETSYGFHGWNLIQLALYLTPVVFLFGIFGLIVLIYKKPYEDTYFFLGILLIFAIFFVPNIHHGWGGPWWMRRYIFAVIPLLCITASYFACNLIDRLSIRVKFLPKKVPVALIVVLLLLPTVIVTYPIVDFVEYKGAVSQTEEIFEPYDNDSILVFVDVSYPHPAYPLREIYDKNALLLRGDFWGVKGEKTDQEDAEKFIQAYNIWTSSGKTIFVVNPSSQFLNALSDEFEFILNRTGRIDIPYLELDMSWLPSYYTHIVREIKIYSVQKRL